MVDGPVGNFAIMQRKIKFGIIGCSQIANSSTIPAILESEYAELFAAAHKIWRFYTASLGYVLIFQKSVNSTPQEIIDLELKYFWKDNESLEKQKKDWDVEIGKFIQTDDATEQHYSTGERLTDPLPATATDIAWEFRDRFLLGFDENEQEHNS